MIKFILRLIKAHRDRQFREYARQADYYIKLAWEKQNAERNENNNG